MIYFYVKEKKKHFLPGNLVKFLVETLKSNQFLNVLHIFMLIWTGDLKIYDLYVSLHVKWKKYFEMEILFQHEQPQWLCN